MAGSREQGTGNRDREAALEAPGLVGRSGWDVVALVAVATGTVLRARHFFTGQSLWLDEAMLALNILGKSCRELFGSLSYDQAAPPLYLCLSRAVAAPLGGSELGLRFPSFLAGVVALVLVWRVGRKLINPEAAAWAVWLLAISPLAISYSNEVKPYMVDALVAVLLIGLARGVLASPREGWRIWWLAGAGLAALLSSFTAPFVLGAAGLVLMLDGVARRDRAIVQLALGLGLLWLTTFALLYLFLYRDAGSSEFLHAYWADYFLSFGPGWRAQIVNAITAVTSGLPIPGSLIRARFLIPAGVVVVGLAARLAGWRVTGLMLFPFLILFLAALLGRYPVADRLVLFLAPATVLLAASGLVAAARLAGLTSARMRGAVIGLLIAGAGIVQVVESPAGPGGPRTARAVVQHADSAAGRDLVLLTRHGTPTWVYYTTDWRNPDRDRLEWFSSRFGFDSVEFHSISDSYPGPPVAIRPTPRGESNARPEAVASPSGLGFRRSGRSDSVFTAWGPSQVAQLGATRATVVWVYGIRPPEERALAAAWAGRGGVVRRHELPSGDVLLELHSLARIGDP